MIKQVWSRQTVYQKMNKKCLVVNKQTTTNFTEVTSLSTINHED
jgi:hypothetical protein